MVYEPKIKNLEQLIIDLEQVVNKKMSPLDLKKKIWNVDYEYDSIDGFEDILDSIRPFIKEYCEAGEGGIWDEKLLELISLLKEQRPFEELEKVQVNYKNTNCSNKAKWLLFGILFFAILLIGMRTWRCI